MQPWQLLGCLALGMRHVARRCHLWLLQRRTGCSRRAVFPPRFALLTGAAKDGPPCDACPTLLQHNFNLGTLGIVLGMLQDRLEREAGVVCMPMFGGGSGGSGGGFVCV